MDDWFDKEEFDLTEMFHDYPHVMTKLSITHIARLHRRLVSVLSHKKGLHGLFSQNSPRETFLALEGTFPQCRWIMTVDTKTDKVAFIADKRIHGYDKEKFHQFISLMLGKDPKQKLIK